jgi:WD40 repeat protein
MGSGRGNQVQAGRRQFRRQARGKGAVVNRDETVVSSGGNLGSDRLEKTAGSSLSYPIGHTPFLAITTMRPYLLQGHERPLTQVKYNREGDLIVSCAKDLKPCLWLADDGTRLGTYEGHGGAVWSSVISWDSTRLITASADQSVRIWELNTGKELHKIKMNEPCRATDMSVGEQLLAFSTDSFMGTAPQVSNSTSDCSSRARRWSERKGACFFETALQALT